MIQIKHRITHELLREVCSDNLIGADLTDADLRGANLTDANLTGANLRGAVLTDAVLTDADLRGANLTDANLTGANLRGAVLTNAVLTGANLTDAVLTDADLTRAVLIDADLAGANLRGANLRGANLTGVIGNMTEVRSLQLDHWPVVIVPKEHIMQIGCERHTLNEWWGFDDFAIDRMDTNAMDWWRKWKWILMQICAELTMSELADSQALAGAQTLEIGVRMDV